MDTNSFVENCLTLTPKDLLQGLHKRSDITYWPEGDDQSVWSISIVGNEPQEIAMQWEDVTFGKRAYFRCDCDHRASKLYLPPDGTQFKCRNCHGLQYHASSFSRYSVAGKAINHLIRLHKLADSRASMSRILYNGKYSKRFERFLRLCERAGFNDIVKGANDLKILLQR